MDTPTRIPADHATRDAAVYADVRLMLQQIFAAQDRSAATATHLRAARAAKPRAGSASGPAAYAGVLEQFTVQVLADFDAQRRGAPPREVRHEPQVHGAALRRVDQGAVGALCRDLAAAAAGRRVRYLDDLAAEIRTAWLPAASSTRHGVYEPQKHAALVITLAAADWSAGRRPPKEQALARRLDPQLRHLPAAASSPDRQRRALLRRIGRAGRR